MRRIALITAAFLAIAPIAAKAAPILDQSQLDGSGQNQAVHSVRTVGQTFTVGTAGLLDSVELSLFETGIGGDLVIDILDMSGGVLPSLAPSLGSVSIAETALGPAPLFLNAGSVTATLIDIASLGILVSVGDVLAINLSSARVLDPPDNLYAVRIALTDLYAGGAYYVGDDFTVGDAAFKTFVTPVPEPGVFTLFGMGLIAMRMARRRNKA